MAKAGSCWFRIGYFLYSRTFVGYYYHLKDIAKSREKLNGGLHSKLTPFVYGDLEILPIPLMLDNYAYLVTDHCSNVSVLLDPGYAEPVQVILSEKNITPEAVLITHKHWDHSGGNKFMKQQYPNIKIYGNSADHVQNITHSFSDGTVLEFGGLRFSVLVTPGHTVGHVVYLLEGEPFGAPDSLFSGDLIFLAGCGRVFEGTSTTMLHSLDKIFRLPDSTLLWPGHEYAQENLEFTCHLDSENIKAQEKLEWVKCQRKKKLCTCPSTLSEEKEYNPFLRTMTDSLAYVLGFTKDGPFLTPNIDTRALMLDEIRERKDQFMYKL